jgi:hypothetical protein
MTEVKNLDDVGGVVAPGRVAGRPGAKGDLVVVLSTLAAALATWTLWTQAAGVELAANTAGGVRPVGAADVAVAALVASVGGVLLLRVFQARSAHGLRSWTVVAVAVGALSLFGALGGVSAAAVAGLLSLHVVVGAVVVLGARRSRVYKA